MINKEGIPMRDYVNNVSYNDITDNENYETTHYGVFFGLLLIIASLIIFIMTLIPTYKVYMSNTTMTCKYVKVLKDDNWVKKECPEKLPKKYETIWVK